MELRILGPLEAHENGRSIPLGGAKQRVVLGLLILHAGKAVSTDRLIDALWGESPPPSALNSLYIYVSRLRKSLGNERVVTKGHGYALELGPDELDATRFERLLAEGRASLAAGDAGSAESKLSEALAIWRGPPFADLPSEEFASDEIGWLEELRLEATEERIEAELALGRESSVVAELEALVRAHPLRERLRGQLMIALYRSGRQAEALGVYRDGRRALAEELGIDPARELQELERRILNHDPTLERVPRAARPDLRRRGPLLVATSAAVLLLAVVGVIVALARGGGGAGLASLAPNSVGMIDPKTNRIVAQVPVGTRPLGVAAAGDTVWVANADDGTVSRIDARARKVMKTIGIGAPATDLVRTTDAVWVGNGSAGTLSRVDPRFDAVVSTVDLRASDSLFPKAVYALVSGEGSIWVASGDRRVLRLDSDTEVVVAQISLRATPFAIAYGEGAVWVATDAAEVLRIEPRTNTVTGRVGAGLAVAVATGGDAVWIAINHSKGIGAVWRLDPETMTIEHAIPIQDPVAIAVGADSVWVASASDATVNRIDPRTNAVVASIFVGGKPAGIAVGSDWVWIAVDEAT